MTVNEIFIIRTLESGKNVGVRLSIWGIFSSGYVLIKGGTFKKKIYSFNIFLYFFYFGYVKENQIFCYFQRGLRLLFLPNIPGATSILDYTTTLVLQRIITLQRPKSIISPLIDNRIDNIICSIHITYSISIHLVDIIIPSSSCTSLTIVSSQESYL